MNFVKCTKIIKKHTDGFQAKEESEFKCKRNIRFELEFELCYLCAIGQTRRCEQSTVLYLGRDFRSFCLLVRLGPAREKQENHRAHDQCDCHQKLHPPLTDPHHEQPEKNCTCGKDCVLGFLGHPGRRFKLRPEFLINPGEIWALKLIQEQLNKSNHCKNLRRCAHDELIWEQELGVHAALCDVAQHIGCWLDELLSVKDWRANQSLKRVRNGRSHSGFWRRVRFKGTRRHDSTKAIFVVAFRHLANVIKIKMLTKEI